LELGIAVLALCAAGMGYSGWRIWRIRKLMSPQEPESIKALTDRFERDMEEIFRSWGNK